MSNEQVQLMNPFPGLRAFEEEEDILFFGREKQIDELLRKLRTSRFLAIIGSSGSGKSSLVKSGLLPSLHSGLMSGAGSQWRIALFRPGNDPIGNMTDALSKNGVLRDDDTTEEQETNRAINEAVLRRSSLGLIECYKQSGLDKKCNLLVLVDQFEELFRFSKYEKDAAEGKRDSIAFINLLLKAAEQKEYPIYVVFTMRSDFLGDCTEFRGLPEAINDGQYLIPRMTRDERREAISGPIAVGGATISPALLNRLLNDVGDNPDQLPLLQHALMRTWDAWTTHHDLNRPIDIEDYERIGTISEAISQHADEAYAELTTDKERQTCERIFKELTDKGGMLNGIRRPRLLSELSAAAGVTDAEAIKIVEIFRKPGRGFLMPAAPAPLTPDSIIDISHESLMRVWKRLITWLEEEQESAQIYMHLCEEVNLFEDKKGGLMRDPELQLTLKWKEGQNINAAWASRYNNYFDKAMFFLEHSKQKRDLEIKHKEELQKQRLKATRRIAVALSIFALLAVIAGIFMFKLKVDATKSKDDAEMQATKARAEEIKAKNNKRAADLARDAAREAEIAAKESADTAIAAKKKAEYLQGVAFAKSEIARRAELAAKDSRDSAVSSKILSDTMAARAERSKRQADESALKEFNARTKAEELKRLAESRNDAHRAIMYMNDSDYANCLKLSMTAYNSYNNNKPSDDEHFQDDDIYSALYLSWRNSFRENKYYKAQGAIKCITLDERTGYYYAGDDDGYITTLENNRGAISKVAEINVHGELRGLSVDAGGTHLLAVMFKQAILYKINGKTLQKVATVTFTGNGKHGVFLGDRYFVVQSNTGVTRFDINNKCAKVDSANIFNCSSIAVARNGSIYISAVKAIKEYSGWDALKSDKTSDQFNLNSYVTAISLEKSGAYLAAGTYGGGVWITSLRGTRDHSSQPRPLHRSAVNDVTFAKVLGDKLQLASASSDKVVKLTEIYNGKLYTDNIISITDHSNWVYALQYSENGEFLLSGSEDNLVVCRPSTMKYIHNRLTTNK